MTYAEAAAVFRRHYDNWQAAALLMDALSRAAEAEKFLGELDANVNVRQAAIFHLEQQITDAQRALAVAVEDRDRILKEASAVNKAKAEAEEAIGTLAAKAGAEREQLATSCNHLQAEIARLGDLVVSTQARRDRLNKEITEQTAVLARLRTDIRTLWESLSA